MASTHTIRKKKSGNQKGEKQRFKVINWPRYNKALVRRGSLTLWIDGEALRGWRDRRPHHHGHPFVYSDNAVTCALTLRHVFRLTLRGGQGFLASLFGMLQVTLPVPDYSTLCRRARSLRVPLPVRARGPVHLVFDSTGLKVFGEGEWKVRQYGWCRRRTWRKLHIALDPDSGELRAVSCTENAVTDSHEFPLLLGEAAKDVCSVTADGAYDEKGVYELLDVLGLPFVIPPRTSAGIWRGWANIDPSCRRHRFIRRINDVGRKQWKEESGYHRRSLIETTMNRWKTVFGDHVRSRTLDRQNTDVHVQATILNRFTALGMPQSVRVA